MKDIFQLHDVARIKAGPFAGLVGRITQQLPGVGGGWLMVRIEGVKDGEPVDMEKKFRPSELERNHG